MKNSIVKPFGMTMTVALGDTGFLRAPLGYVFKDLYLSNLGSQYIKISVQRDRMADKFIQYADGDMLSGEVGISLDFVTPALYWTAAGVIRWENIGSSECRSLAYENNSGGWAANTVLVWGVFEPDPGCYRG